MAQVLGFTEAPQNQDQANMDEIAAYLRDILEERHSVAKDVRLLTEVLDSIKRDLMESSPEKRETRPAA